MMGNIYNFYGDLEDVLGVWKFMSDLPGMQFIEEFSQKNRKNQQFEAFPGEQFLEDGRFTIAAWPSVVGGQPRQRIERLSPESAARLRASGTCVLESPAFIRMATVAAPNDQLIGPRELFYWTEKNARRYGKNIDFDEAQLQEVDWAQLKIITDKIISHIKRSSEARWNSMPVLPGCARDLRGGSKKLWCWGRVGTI
jgi:hypothetical protein